MPYITKEQRRDVEAVQPLTDGELNYAITKEIMRYVALYGSCYATFNAVIGVLESAKQEFYRRVVVPYEDQKCKENGDVYE